MEYFYDGICLQNGRESNMDSLLLTERCIAGEQTILAVVCDGVGSMTEGAYASIESIRMMGEWISKVAEPKRLGLRMRDEVALINDRILKAATERCVQTATTLSALLIAGRQYFIVHAGDSRIYSLCGGRFSLLTVDDINEAGKLTSYIGKRSNQELFYAEGTTNCDTFLLCTDGLYKRLDEEWISGNIDAGNRKAIRRTLNALAGYAIEQGEQDNISVAIVRVT